MESLGPLSLFLGPPRRGAQDRIAEAVSDAVAPDGADDRRVTVVSQQVSHPDVISALAQARSATSGGAVRVLMERDYLFERSPVPVEEIWLPGGSSEVNRNGLVALMRSAISVRFDHLRGDLMHINAVISETDDSTALLLTSANLSPGSLDRHLNWALQVNDTMAAVAFAESVSAAWDGDFRDVELDMPIGEVGGRIVMDAAGKATEAFVDAIDAAQESVELAYFNLAAGSPGVLALREAVARGVTVTGVVDADQGNQSWDGVADLRESGADIRYYPGARTGAVGRMHHKLAVVDRSVGYLSTANLSNSALSSLEVAILISDAGVLAKALVGETRRLHAGASRRPLAEAPV